MFNIALFEPEIPPNTGNIIRLAANTGCQLHLIEPLGFELDDKRMRRAGLDYNEFASVITYSDWTDFITQQSTANIYALTTKGSTPYDSVKFREDDFFLFGPETRGLPEEIRTPLPEQNKLRVPMFKDSRSLNLSNTVALVVYEAWRQNDFKGGH